MKNKICPKCNIKKLIKQFSFKDKAKRLLQSWCKSCNIKYHKKHYILNRKSYLKDAAERKNKRVSRNYKYVRAIKSSTPCSDCKNIYHHIAMDFDHIKGKKAFNITRACSEGLSLNTISKEIAKCEVVCSNCHRIRTWKRNK